MGVEISVALVRHDHKDVLIAGSSEDIPEERREKKSKKRKIRLSRAVAPRVVAWQIASTRSSRSTNVRLPRLTIHLADLSAVSGSLQLHTRGMLLSPILLASFPLWHVMLDGPYQAVRIIPDKTVDKRYVVRISEPKSTLIFNTQDNYVRLLRVRSREISSDLIKRDNREILKFFNYLFRHMLLRICTNISRIIEKTIVICTKKKFSSL